MEICIAVYIELSSNAVGTFVDDLGSCIEIVIEWLHVIAKVTVTNTNTLLEAVVVLIAAPDVGVLNIKALVATWAWLAVPWVVNNVPAREVIAWIHSGPGKLHDSAVDILGDLVEVSVDVVGSVGGEVDWVG